MSSYYYPGQAGGFVPLTRGVSPAGYPTAAPPPIGFATYAVPPGCPAPYPSQPGYPVAYSPQPGHPAAQPPQPGYPVAQPSQSEYATGHLSQPRYPVAYSPQSGYPVGQPPQSEYATLHSSQPRYSGACSSQPGYPAYHPGNLAPAYPNGYSAASPVAVVQYSGGVLGPVSSPSRRRRGPAATTRPVIFAPSAKPRPSIRPWKDFDPSDDAETLYNAMKGIGCNKSLVISVLCKRPYSQRQMIAIKFKTMYGKDLQKELKSELHFCFEDLILALMENPARYDAFELQHAMEGVGTRESVLIEIMCTRSNAQILEIRRVYAQMFQRRLETDLIGDTSGWFRRLLVSMCAAGRDESNLVDPTKASQDAKKLLKAGVGRLGTDEACFSAILAQQNYAQLRLVFQEYERIAKHSIEKAIRGEFSGNILKGLLAIVGCVQNRPAFFAELLYNSMHGLGTRDRDLIRLVVTRAEIDLADIRDEFQRKYHRSLESMIQSDTSGAYRNGLVALVRGN